MEGEGRSHQEGRDLLLPWGGHDQSRHLHPNNHQFEASLQGHLPTVINAHAFIECIESDRFVIFAPINRSSEVMNALAVEGGYCVAYFLDDAPVQLQPVVHD